MHYELSLLRCIRSYRQVEELFATGLPVNVKDQHGNQCIHIAAQNGSKRMVKVCLRWGADINAQNVSARAPAKRAVA